eukprot:GFUD01022910.1.p1 GENE.GFUD01022910.1~~GFUD01022910.1.p1  ORF type:complete len:283 (-),score=49.75 GFUD01022910.1:48-896(-)
MAVHERIAMCLEPNSDLPTDVRFLFLEEGNIVKEVKGHKLILAIASDVFKREFFGYLMEVEAKDIEIKDARHEVFKTMVEFIYNKQLDWKDYDLDFLSCLYYLGEKYHIEKLKKEIIASIPGFKVSMENVLDVAILAEQNSHHEPLSEALYNTATTFLKIKFEGKLENALNFCSENEATETHGLVLFKMMAMMNNIVLPKAKCETCQQTSCLNAQILTAQNFVPGAKVVPNPVVNANKVGNPDIDELICMSESNSSQFSAYYKNSRRSNNSFTVGFYKYKCF